MSVPTILSERLPLLLVDDDPQSLDSTRKILEQAGYAVVCATDGEEALTLVQGERAQKFALVVSDVRMPRMGGLEFLKALRVIRDETPVVLMTAFGKVEDAVWALKFGAVDFLSKPFRKQALINAVALAIGRRRTPCQKSRHPPASPAMPSIGAR